MKRSTAQSYIPWSILILLSGIINAGFAVYLMIFRMQSAGNSRFSVIAAMLLMIASGILEIIAGIKSNSFFRKTAEGERLRAPKSKVLSFRRLVLFAMILCLIQMIFTLIAGLLIWQFAVIVFFGLFLPLLFLIRTRDCA